jgi:hypothetical protein
VRDNHAQHQSQIPFVSSVVETLVRGRLSLDCARHERLWGKQRPSRPNATDRVPQPTHSALSHKGKICYASAQIRGFGGRAVEQMDSVNLHGFAPFLADVDRRVMRVWQGGVAG